MATDTSVQELREALASSRARLLETIRGVTEEQFKRRPPDGGWCIAEVLAHQLASEQLRAERVQLGLTQSGAEITPSDAAALEAQARAGRIAPVPQIIHGLLAARREIERLLDAAEAIDGGLERFVVHPREGRQTVGWMLREEVAGLEVQHVERIEVLKASLGPASS